MARAQRYPRRTHRPLLRIASWCMFAGLIGFVAFQKELLVRAFEVATPVRHVRLEGNFDGLEPSQFEASIVPHVRGSFFLLRLEELESIASEVPWVGGVRVSRVWPDTLVFKVEELDPVARWGDRQLISSSGEIFERPVSRYDFDQLTVLKGPRGREKELLEMHQQLAAKFAEKGEHIDKLVLSERLAWTVRLGSGLEINYGNQPPLVATDRLFEFLPSLRAQNQSALRSIDLRYPRGFAVSFKPVSTGGSVIEDSKG